MFYGFFVYKDMWFSVVKFFLKNLYLVCVDMLGYEGIICFFLDDLFIDG